MKRDGAAEFRFRIPESILPEVDTAQIAHRSRIVRRKGQHLLILRDGFRVLTSSNIEVSEAVIPAPVVRLQIDRLLKSLCGLHVEPFILVHESKDPVCVGVPLIQGECMGEVLHCQIFLAAGVVKLAECHIHWCDLLIQSERRIATGDRFIE